MLGVPLQCLERAVRDVVIEWIHMKYVTSLRLRYTIEHNVLPRMVDQCIYIEIIIRAWPAAVIRLYIYKISYLLL